MSSKFKNETERGARRSGATATDKICMKTICHKEITKLIRRESHVARSLTVFIHVDPQALLEATGLALVTSSGVDEAPTVSLTHVLHVTTYRTLEETTAAVTARHSVVFPGRTVTTDQAAANSTAPQPG